MKTDTTLRLTRTQYRQLAEVAKQDGCCLSLASVAQLRGNWGLFTPWALGIHDDATSNEARMRENVVIEVATTVNAARLRRAVRPEIDWSQLEDHEVFPFIVAHEIGHFRDNHFPFDIFKIEDLEARARCERVISSVNEVLADRFAWSRIRPGEPVPLCENGKRVQREVAEAMELLDKYIPRQRRSPRVLPAGQYRWIPQSMLESEQLTAFVGPKVSPALIERSRQRRRIHRLDTRRRG
ncbi:hypothetical protein [Pseudomonas massiliensis]|uniref:hypothetical protein n=1 Tax=Pseudomonas massiliensis TaxID=522492 RepID=UPI00058C3FE9|nr:hypothetical protein [Pseudomonas massiliensis]